MELFNIVVGLSYCFSSMALIVLNGLLLMVMNKYKDYSTMTYFIIKNICVVGIAQLISFFVGGIMTIANSTFHFWLDKSLGALVQSGWFLYLGLSLTLAIDRLLLFIPPKSPRLKKFITSSFLLLSWTIWIITGFMLLMPDFSYTYLGPNGLYLWVYSDDDGSSRMQSAESYFDLIMFGLVFLVYIVVFGHLVKVTLVTVSVRIKSTFPATKIDFC
ncbi:hypothetical protein QR680_003692 [Steinernema hermaphroditum]|uniref:7TM GPCR serpentine receptor class x (Srx) domain-containing protein n=1 Tax=Steinernema hermaphroditum TaxID=289476 RepID=A0AA39HMK5_9BILA|nr:hypothetical protein QR680_003692 [Steinernema hermaphroditum]